MNKLKDKKFAIYYFIVIAIILIGFVVGTETKEYDEGYRVYDYSHKEYSEYMEDYYYPSAEIGDNRIDKYIGWYGMYFVKDSKYYDGDKEISRDILEDAMNYKQRMNDDFDFHYVNVENIIGAIIIIIILLAIPFIIIIVKKCIKKKKNK